MPTPTVTLRDARVAAGLRQRDVAPSEELVINRRRDPRANDGALVMWIWFVPVYTLATWLYMAIVSWRDGR